MLRKALKADGTVDTISYNAWRLGPGWWGFGNEIASTAGNDAVVCFQDQGTQEPISFQLTVSRGTERNQNATNAT